MQDTHQLYSMLSSLGCPNNHARNENAEKEDKDPNNNDSDLFTGFSLEVPTPENIANPESHPNQVAAVRECLNTLQNLYYHLQNSLPESERTPIARADTPRRYRQPSETRVNTLEQETIPVIQTRNQLGQRKGNEILLHYYENVSKHPSHSEKKRLAEKSGKSFYQVHNFFSNRRYRMTHPRKKRGKPKKNGKSE